MNLMEKIRSLELENGDSNEEDGSDSEEYSNEEEIASTFSSSCKLLTRTNEVDECNKYVLHIDGTVETNPTLAVGYSDGSVDVFHLSGDRLAKTESMSDDTGSCLGVKLNSDNHNLLFTGSSKGAILLWDLRTAKSPVSEFKDTTVQDNDHKPMTCFDVSPNNRLLATGTELYKGDAFILFWDIRNVKLLGGYWESHTDLITQLRFHPERSDSLLSGSTDGLINIYNLAEANEDDALLNSLNTTSSVEEVRWFSKGQDYDIFCATHTFDVQLWGVEDAEPYVEFKRPSLGKFVKQPVSRRKISNKKPMECAYVGGAYVNSQNNLTILIGSGNKVAECFRGVTVQKNSLKPEYNFIGNKQRVRAVLHNKIISALITGGEKGTVDIWKEQ